MSKVCHNSLFLLQSTGCDPERPLLVAPNRCPPPRWEVISYPPDEELPPHV